MAYDEHLADRIRTATQDVEGVRERRMFGGLAFMVQGHMAVAAGSKGGLMVRVDPTRAEALVSRAHTGRMVMQGRKMDGWLLVDAPGVKTDRQLTFWVDTGVAYAGSLPPK